MKGGGEKRKEARKGWKEGGKEGRNRIRKGKREENLRGREYNQTC